MAWTIRLSAKAIKTLGKLDRPTAKKIYHELQEIEKLNNPMQRGKALAGNLRGLWRYRVGDYRIVCSLEHDVLVVLVIDIGHRSEIYRQ